MKESLYINYKTNYSIKMEGQIFTLEELKEVIYSACSEGEFPYEKSDFNKNFFRPQEGSFEAIQIKKGIEEFMLLPSEQQYPYLFRGQIENFTPCYPSLYRGDPTEIDIFIERLRLMQFIELINTHPVIDHFFKANHFNIDYVGLAQHYGIKTEMLDFTSELDIALFFAMCPYDKCTDSYRIIDKKENIGYLYIISPLLYDTVSCSNKLSIFDGKISPIGLQVFDRPGVQRGFELRLENRECLQAWMYRFRYEQRDSEKYLAKYNNGSDLWLKDILVRKTKNIAVKQEFSYDLFNKTFNRYKPKGFSKSKMKQALIDKEIKLYSQNVFNEIFTETEKTEIVKEWNEIKCKQFTSLITRRFWLNTDCFFYNENGDKVFSEEFKYRTCEMLALIEELRLIQTATVAPKGGIKIGTPLSNNKKSNRFSICERRPGYLISAKGVSFLLSDDWIIE